MPKRIRHRKVHRGRMRGRAHAGTTVAFGEYGLQAEGAAWITSRQIEAARRAITRHIRRGGKVWIRIFPDKPVTKKPAETRMGSGKGSLDHWVAVVKPGRILFELAGVREEVAREALRLAGHKLPIETRFVVRPPELPPYRAQAPAGDYQEIDAEAEEAAEAAATEAKPEEASDEA